MVGKPLAQSVTSITFYIVFRSYKICEGEGTSRFYGYDGT